MCPDIEEYAELLVHVASAQSRVEQETLQDVMKILSVIGEQIFISDDDPEIETKKMLSAKHFPSNINLKSSLSKHFSIIKSLNFYWYKNNWFLVHKILNLFFIQIVTKIMIKCLNMFM
jgi:hypothetical protein